MIQRTLLRQSRTLGSRVTPRVSLARPQFAPAQPTTRASWAQASRFYSAEAETKKEDASTPKEEPKTAPSEPVDPTKKELEEKKKEIIDLKDKYVRQVAEYRNLQERTKRDMASARDFAIQKFAKDLVESIDNLDRALSMVPANQIDPSHAEHNKDVKSLYDGLKMTEEILMSTLKKHGLERFDPSVEGEKFNPNEHEATFMTPMEGKTDGTVFLTQQKGFKLNGRVLRAAKVGVVKNA